MGDKKIERHYWCKSCIAFRPVRMDRQGVIHCVEGHELDLGLHIDWTFPYAEASEGRA
jgi:hypothetical protein